MVFKTQFRPLVIIEVLLCWAPSDLSRLLSGSVSLLFHPQLQSSHSWFFELTVLSGILCFHCSLFPSSVFFSTNCLSLQSPGHNIPCPRPATFWVQVSQSVFPLFCEPTMSLVGISKSPRRLVETQIIRLYLQSFCFRRDGAGICISRSS